MERGGYEKTNGGGLRSGKTIVTIGFSAIFTLKYDTRENAWYLQEFAFGANASFVVKYDIRLAVCPLVYGYVSLSLSGTVTTGGTFQRTVVEGDYPIVAKGAAKTLKKGEKVEFDTPYINANIEFNGKIYIKTDAVSGEKVNNGFLTSQGGSERQLQFKSTTYSMCFDKERTTRHITIVALADTTINYLNTIESIKSELVWSGVKVAPKIQGEIGVGAGVEGLKVEAFIKTVISANFVFGQLQKDGSRKALAVDSASFSLSLAFRAVLLMMSWEMDAVGVQAKYDGKEDKWTAEYILLGKSHPLENGRGLAGAGDDAEEHFDLGLSGTYKGALHGKEIVPDNGRLRFSLEGNSAEIWIPAE